MDAPSYLGPLPSDGGDPQGGSHRSVRRPCSSGAGNRRPEWYKDVAYFEMNQYGSRATIISAGPPDSRDSRGRRAQVEGTAASAERRSERGVVRVQYEYLVDHALELVVRVTVYGWRQQRLKEQADQRLVADLCRREPGT